MAITFNTANEDFDLIGKIAERAVALQNEHRHPRARRTRMDFVMDIAGCHASGTPLNLTKLLAADDFNFAHDVFGIERHLDRETGELHDGFSPRHSAPQSQAA